MPRLRAAPSTATTWPCGLARRIAKAASSEGRATPPLSRVLSPSTSWSGHAFAAPSVDIGRCGTRTAATAEDRSTAANSLGC